MTEDRALPRANEPTERTCIVTRETQPVDALIRFVVAPDGAVVPDLRRRLPGRGRLGDGRGRHGPNGREAATVRPRLSTDR